MVMIISEVEGFRDHRADRYFDIYPELHGQITVSVVEPHQFSGWHKHKLQYDIFFVASGELKISIISPDGVVEEVFFDASNRQSVFIPPLHWHCYKSFGSQATLIYYLSRKHDEDDEYRASDDEIFSWFQYRI